MTNAVGINRYIMECKFFGNYIPFPGKCELIDTLWNVNENNMYFFSYSDLN